MLKFIYYLWLITCLTIVESLSNTSQITESIQEDRVNKNFIRNTLDLLYIIPEKQDGVLNLNEKHTIGNEYEKGWILPSEEPISLNLYLYYEGHDENKIKQFLKNSTHQASNQASLQLYLFFTSEMNCGFMSNRNYRSIEIVERIGTNTYLGKLNNINLVYSQTPSYICLQQIDSEDTLHVQNHNRDYSHQGDDYWVSIVTTKSFLPTWARIILFGILLTLSGLFSGLNLGLMSLDLSELDILKRIGTPIEQSYASKIYPLRKRGNFLLCTILLGNVLVNSVSTLILGDMLSGVYAAFGSTILIVIFGEIIPQAACSKHGLAVGAYTRYIMYFFMILTSPLSFPLSIILDKILGQEITAQYTREKIREVMNVVEGLDDKEKKIISGALDFNKKMVKDVMTKLDDVFMLEINSCLNFETIAKIAQEGYSRIPVFEKTRDNIVGLLHVKDFTLLDPDDNMPVQALLKFYNHPRIFCDAEQKIDERFEEFRKGETHLAFVYDIFPQEDRDPIKTCIGIVTLEDIIEELVQMEIYDEFDEKKEFDHEELKPNKQESDTQINQENDENSHLLSVNIESGNQVDFNRSNSSSNSGKENQTVSDINESKIQSDSKNKKSIKSYRPIYENQTSKDLSFFLQQQKDTSQRIPISPQIRFVMFQFLSTTVKPFTSEFLTKNVLELIFKRAIFKESRRTDPKFPREYLYKYGKGCNYFILIISGEATIEVGKEKLEFAAGPFAYFGVNGLLCGFESAEQMFDDDPSLSDLSEKNIDNTSLYQKSFTKQYIPDFSLRVDEKCVYMKIDRSLWRNGVIKSWLDRTNNQKSDTIDDVPLNSGNHETNEEQKENKTSKFTVSSEKNRSFSMDAEALKNTFYSNKSPEKIELKNVNSLSKVKEDNLESENDIVSDFNNTSFMDNESEPFIAKKHSTTSLNVFSIQNRKGSNSTKNDDKFQTMSQKSFDEPN